jgi:hypothetical protein
MNDKIIKGLVIGSSLGLSACTVNSSDYNARLNTWENKTLKDGVQLQSRVIPKYDNHFIWMGMREIDYLDRVEYRIANQSANHMCAQLKVRSAADDHYDETHWNKSVVRDVNLIAPNEIKYLGFYQLPRRSGDNIASSLSTFQAHQDDNGYSCDVSDDVDCYITTAMCRDTGKPDDCAELQSLRKYRDEVMLNDPEGRELVKEYYVKAPKIVSLINQEADHFQIYKMLREQYITPAANAADAGEYAKALELYKAMVDSLSKKYESFI